jgi:FlaA1/EpsC-like NDP-sugar epimerase
MPILDTPPFIASIHDDVYPAIDPRSALAGTAAGKTVLVTGSGRGIGKAIAVAFAHAGAACIILTSRTPAQLDEVEQEIRSAVKYWK